MKILTTEDGRGLLIDLLTKIKPKKIIAPFGYDFQTNDNCMMIMQDKKFIRTHNRGNFRFSKNTHAKLIISDEQIVFGSSNFTMSSLGTKHELVCIVNSSDADWDYIKEKSEIFFEQLWMRLK